MRAFVDVVVVHRAKHRSEAVRIEHIPFAAIVAGAIADRLPPLDLDASLEETRLVAALQFTERPAVPAEGNDLFGMRNEGSGDPDAMGLLQAQYGERVRILPCNNLPDLVRMGLPLLQRLRPPTPD